jgi:hypothetical protein
MMCAYVSAASKNIRELTCWMVIESCCWLEDCIESHFSRSFLVVVVVVVVSSFHPPPASLDLILRWG